MRRHARERNQGAGDGGVDHRPRHRDGDFVPWILGNAAQRGDAADGQQGDALHLHAKLLGHNAMPKFVQRDAGEDRAEHCHRPAGAVRASLLEPAVGDERQKNQKGHVQPQRDPEHTPD